MDWIRLRNRRRIEAIWREVYKPPQGSTRSLMADAKAWQFYEGLLAAVPAGEDDESDLADWEEP